MARDLVRINRWHGLAMAAWVLLGVWLIFGGLSTLVSVAACTGGDYDCPTGGEAAAGYLVPAAVLLAAAIGASIKEMRLRERQR